MTAYNVSDYNANISQLKAITSTQPRILCLAGAGTGKTKTLTSRIAHLVENRVSCGNMLALTFTRLAGMEMKDRVINLIGQKEGKKLFCNTFHSFCAKVIRDNASLIDLDEDFSIYDDVDTESIIKSIISDFKYKDAKLVEVLKILEHGYVDNEWNISSGSFNTYMEFQNTLKRNNALDFNSLMTKTLYIFDTFPDVLEEYHKLYQYVFVDEFQDTNDMQWDIIKKLNPANLFCVGDDFQSIYGWRGANINIIMDLAVSPEWETIKLEINYRSTEQIVEASNRLIKNNNQTDKLLYSDKGPGEEDIQYTDESTTRKTWPDNERYESAAIASDIKIRLREAINTSAVLARTNRQLSIAKEVFDQMHIPCVIINNLDDVFKKDDIRGIIAFMQLHVNNNDNYAFMKAMNFPETRISTTAFTNIKTAATFKESSLYQCIQLYLPAGKHSSIISICEYLDNIDAEEYSAETVFWSIANTMLELDTRYRNEGLHNRLEDLYEAGSQISEWARQQKKIGEGVDPVDFLKWLRLKDLQEKLTSKTEAVKLMTIHAAKGLEFDHVYVIGLNEGVFPSSKGDIEEERRLMYVAMTRAKEVLTLSSTRYIKRYGKEIVQEPSRFLEEITLHI